jgi:hypothetical protein
MDISFLRFTLQGHPGVYFGRFESFQSGTQFGVGGILGLWDLGRGLEVRDEIGVHLIGLAEEIRLVGNRV